MKPFDYYSKPQTLYPHKKDYTTFYVYDKGACIAEEMRNKVVLYCVEKPDLCKTEYNNIKTQNKLNTYQKPEIK